MVTFSLYPCQRLLFPVFSFQQVTAIQTGMGWYLTGFNLPFCDDQRLSIFHFSWLPVCLFWENVSSQILSLHFNWLSCFFFFSCCCCCWVVWVLYGLDISLIQYKICKTSLVVHCIGICLPMQEVWVLSLVWKDSHAVEQLSPFTTTTEPML